MEDGGAQVRVLIEFLDQDPINNVLGACIFQPETVVYLCDHRDARFLKESAIYRLFKQRKIKTQPRFYYFDASDPMGVRRVLGAVLNDYPGCVLDFTGGRDLVLLVAGAAFAELQLPAYYIDVSRRRFINLRGCEALAERFEMPSLSADDVFAMTGAAVHGHGHFNSESSIDFAFEEDALACFEIVLKNPRAWGEFVAFLQGLCSGTPAGQLTVAGSRRQKNGRGGKNANPMLLQRLREAGLITHYTLERHSLELTFKSPLHRRCLLIEGVWLELYCYVTARRSGAFNDVRTSIVVDWAGEKSGSNTAKNEVDVLLVAGVIPVFISCKMSLPQALALSEIKLLSEKFGGRRSRAVVLTAGQLSGEHLALQARAKDLNIHLLDGRVLRVGTLAEALKDIAGLLPPKDEPRLSGQEMPPDGLLF